MFPPQHLNESTQETMSNISHDALFDAETQGARLPFLTYGAKDNQTGKYATVQYGLQLDNVKEWTDKVSQEWRCRFEMEVVESEGEGALKPGTKVCYLIREDRRYKFHEKDFQNIIRAVLEPANKTELADLMKDSKDFKAPYTSKYKGKIFMAQVAPNDKKTNKTGEPYSVVTFHPVSAVKPAT